jgi:mRNA interferase MazF
MKRGELVTVALRGKQGKPRPALVIQADHFEDLPSVTILPITSTLGDRPAVRVPIEPTPDNGLAQSSQVMIDKVQTPPLTRVDKVIGRADEATMHAVSQALAVFLGIA